jgi:hypothetical protein
MTSQHLTRLQRILAFLGRFVALLAALLLCIPVLLLPQATAVPAWVWIPLGAINVALLVLFFWLKPAWKGAAVSAGRRSCWWARLAVFASQAFATTPPITDDCRASRCRAASPRWRWSRSTAASSGSRSAGRMSPKPVLALPGGRARRQPIGDRTLRARRVGGALRRRQLGAAGRGQILRRRGSRHADAGTLHRGRARADPAPAGTLRPGEGLRPRRVVGQRAGRHAGAALPRACFTPSSAPGRWSPSWRPTSMDYDFALQWAQVRGDIGQGRGAHAPGTAALLRRT